MKLNNPKKELMKKEVSCVRFAIMINILLYPYFFYYFYLLVSSNH